MLELEAYMRQRYENIDYAILYFNFMDHEIPSDSRIINIVINITHDFTDHTEAYRMFRRYGGKVLSDLFRTPLIIGWDNTTFDG
jgi:hypothetical protein